MKKFIKVDQETRRAIADDYAAKMPIALICQKYHVSRAFPIRVAKEFNVPPHGRGGHPSSGRIRRKGDILSVPDVPAPPQRAPLDVAEARRLKSMRLGLTRIAALLRAPYKDVALACEGC